MNKPLTPKQRAKAIKRACEQTETALNTLRPLMDDWIIEGVRETILSATKVLRREYAALAEEIDGD